MKDGSVGDVLPHSGSRGRCSGGPVGAGGLAGRPLLRVPPGRVPLGLWGARVTGGVGCGSSRSVTPEAAGPGGTGFQRCGAAAPHRQSPSHRRKTRRCTPPAMHLSFPVSRSSIRV